ncbi:MAG: hypothetical protein GWM89_10365 [Candidatus Dadabacteria bacterium]|nr:hypothetical protein [Candidatus Dadabacteria bacterium]NIX15479.1 hypothetical protein [Candidatus Dadabacteria bacterium]NIY22800.1 hypothetical protein [Candidatus Dadabacteria bacterium]
MTFNTQLAVTSAITYTMSAQDMIDLEKIKKNLYENKPYIKAALKPYIIYSLDFMYKDLGEDEIKGYIKFYESDITQHFNKVVSDSYLKAIARASFDFGERSADFIKNRQKQEET